MKTVTYGIPSWSHKVFKARRTYVCRNCGGLIPSGTIYCRHVVRHGPRKGRDPLENIHVHIDCTAPWFQPDNITHRLQNIARLPLKLPEADAVATMTSFAPALFLQQPHLGTLQWQLPEGFAAKLQAHRSGPAALAEMQTLLGIALTAITKSAGNKRQAMRVNNLITQLVDIIA